MKLLLALWRARKNPGCMFLLGGAIFASLMALLIRWLS